MISAFLIQQERRRGRRFLRQRDGAPEVGDDLVSAGLRPSSAETRSRGKTVEVCGRAAVEKSSQISPKTSVYIGGTPRSAHVQLDDDLGLLDPARETER